MCAQQITQQRLPIAQDGMLKFDVVDKQGQFQYNTQVRIERIQIEQDSGKSLHNLSDDFTLVDLNRAGVGLLEVVFAPDLKTPLEASSCLRAIQKLFRHLGVCDGNMQDGSMRCDVNVSVREHRDTLPVISKNGHQENFNSDKDDSEGNGGSILQGNRVEVKNINSIQSVQSAAHSEINRHISILESNNLFPQETRGFDDATQTTFTMRAKETAVDYRIFPDPDIPVLTITDEDIAEARGSAEGEGRVELPEVTVRRMVETYGLEARQAESLMGLPGGQTFFEAVHAHTHGVTDASNSSSEKREKHRVGEGVIGGSDIYNWMLGDLLGNLNNHFFNFLNSPVEPSQLHSLISLVANKDISALQAKKVLKCLFEPEYIGTNPAVVKEAMGFSQVSDEALISQLISQSLADPKNSKKLETYHGVSAKRDRMTSFFVGDVMKRSKGQASPQAVKTLLSEALLETISTGESKQQ